MELFDEMFSRIRRATRQRAGLAESLQALRLFNGFYEGCPDLVLDRYADTLVIFDHARPDHFTPLIQEITRWALTDLEGCRVVVHKQRQHPDPARRNGVVLAGQDPAHRIREHGADFALDLQLNQDASFYLDTRGLRRWLMELAGGLRVLNTFAYTGSLGVAAGVGGAREVVQTDLNPRFLALARASWDLNRLPADNQTLLSGDFFRVAGRMRHSRRLFDCVILDPPFFSTTDAGTVDLVQETTRLVNKIRPVVAHEGYLVVINNALFLSGDAFMTELESLCRGGYLALAGTIPVPADVTGFTESVVSEPPADPAPFNHPTKIAILRAFRKDRRT